MAVSKKLFQVQTKEREIHEYVYYIEAGTSEEAKELLTLGGLDYASHKWLTGEIIDVEISPAENRDQGGGSAL